MGRQVPLLLVSYVIISCEASAYMATFELHIETAVFLWKKTAPQHSAS